jgi:uncharacterized repeat protein (TIGR03943 family)
MNQIKIRNNLNLVVNILDISALLAWGILFLKYWFTGQLRLLIHPNYFLLVLITGLIFIFISLIRIWKFWQELHFSQIARKLDHLNLLPQGWSSGLLLITAILGLSIEPSILTSQAALQRGVSDSLPLTREQPQAFRTSSKPEDRTLIEWVRTLNAYPEPDNYEGQQAKISGFVVYIEEFPENYLYLSRFILTCCAVDAYPVGIPVKLPQPRTNYPLDSWLEVEGEMITESLPNFSDRDSANQTNKRQLVLKARSLKPIPTPKDPYGY